MLYCDALRIEEYKETYQKAMNAIFLEHIRKIVKCYVNNIAVKSRVKGDHIADLKTVFDIKWAHKLKIDPAKSFLGVTAVNFLSLS